MRAHWQYNSEAASWVFPSLFYSWGDMEKLYLTVGWSIGVEDRGDSFLFPHRGQSRFPFLLSGNGSLDPIWKGCINPAFSFPLDSHFLAFFFLLAVHPITFKGTFLSQFTQYYFFFFLQSVNWPLVHVFLHHFTQWLTLTSTFNMFSLQISKKKRSLIFIKRFYVCI